jgi:hypothetical protein
MIACADLSSGPKTTMRKGRLRMVLQAFSGAAPPMDSTVISFTGDSQRSR